MAPAAQISGTGPDDRTALEAALDKAIRVPSPVIRAHVDRLTARNPEANAEQILALLEKELLRVVTSTGAAVGAAAAVPAVGTATAAALTVSDLAAFFAASAAYTLAVADVHGIAVDDVERRRALVLATVLGEDGTKALTSAGISPVAWGRVLVAAAPSNTIKRVNKVLTGRFLKRYLAKQSGLALGRLVPFGVGAAVGAIGGRALAKGVVRQAAGAFGPPPLRVGEPARVVEPAPPADASRQVEGA
ncbi:hypothetical protein ATL41_2226 [Flavimobilis soli]|uniref:EcsC family protein n=1 Tax=Flavimobilis soli TaxID=442709 RepID=A0A2A9EEX4_9MICO|nr:hypothetical protein [Flavimobilis soli]PFG37464.1 hypothetical protein ATL41_2226 [Flavimobilis soli]